MKNKSRTCISLIKTKTGELMMAGDRKVSADWSFSYSCPNPKIRKSWNGILTGASGDSGLCKTIIDVFEPPKMETEDTDLYMAYYYVPALHKHLKNIPGYIDEHRLLRLAVDESCLLIIGLSGKGYVVDISNPEEEYKEAPLARIVFDDIPIPFSIGCGSTSALPILLDEYNNKKYNTKATLTKAMIVAAEISPGCNASLDFLVGD